MPINSIQTLPSNPKLDIIISGLCAVCFSESNQRAEIGFINVEDHRLELRIYEQGSTEPFYFNVLDKDTEIKINAASRSMGFSFCPNDTETSDDARRKDYRQMIDLHEIYDEGLRFTAGAEFYAKLYISEAVFYTYCLSRYPIDWFWVDADGETQTRHGNRIGKILGAKIENPQSGIEINAEKLEMILPDKNYLIEIRFRCGDDDSRDLLKVYDVLNGLNGRPRYGLFYNENEPTCFLPSDGYRFQNLANKINNMLSNKDSDSASRREQEKIAEEMESLACRFRDRKACQNVVLSNVPIDLDGE